MLRIGVEYFQFNIDIFLSMNTNYVTIKYFAFSYKNFIHLWIANMYFQFNPIFHLLNKYI